ncbi:hypothetical protein JCM5350_004901 [Sporobolomyces pararoseus]
MHLFQAYDNILQIVYSTSSEQLAGGGATSTKVKSLLEICAREIGWEIETSIRDWLDQVQNDDGSDLEGEWTMEKMERHLAREANSRRRNSHLSRGDSSSEAEEGESTSRRTSSSSVNNVSGVLDLTRGEQDLESSRIQDEAYETCPSHTYRWILAEHATSIVYNELGDLLEQSDAVPYELVENWFDWCLSYGATSEASRFHSLLISTALRPISLAPTTSTKPSFLPLLLKSPSYLSLLSNLESHLSESTFQDKLFFHPYLSTTIPNTSLSTLGTSEFTRIKSYLEMMIKLARTMIESYLEAYRDQVSSQKSHSCVKDSIEGLEKDTKEIFERVLKLVGAVTGDTALRNATTFSGRKKGKRSLVGTRQGILGGLTRLSVGEGEAELEELRTELGGLRELSKEIERIAVRDRSLDSDTEDEVEEDEIPTICQQLGSIVLYLDLVALLRSSTASTSLCQSSSTTTVTSTFCIPLTSHYISTYLLPSISPNSLLLICDKLDHLPRSRTNLDAEKALLIALGGDGFGLEFGEDFAEEVERRWSRMEKKVEEQDRNPGSRMDRTKQALSAAPSRGPASQNFASSNPQPERKPCRRPRRPRSFDLTSESEVDHSDLDTDVIVVSPSQSPAPRSPPPLPSNSARRFLVVPLAPPARFLDTPISSEPDELALLPPPRRFLVPRVLLDSPPRKPKTKRPRIAVQVPLSPSPPAPLELEEVQSTQSRSSTLPPAHPTERREKVVPLRRKRLECHVRNHSAPTIIFSNLVSKTTRQIQDEDDELMMSF